MKDPGTWPQALRLLESFLIRHDKVEHLWEQIPAHIPTEQKRSCRGRVLAALRYGHLIDQLICLSARRAPKPRLRALLMIAGGEWLSHGLAEPNLGQLALTTHHAVGIAKQHLSHGEAQFINAMLRNWPATLEKHFPTLESRLLATCAPGLIARWQKQFAPALLQQLLAWNLMESGNWLYSPRTHTQTPIATTLAAGPWLDYYALPSGPIDASISNGITHGEVYIKDPGTRFAIDWLAPCPGDCVLDLCAAPGGKSFQIAHVIGFNGQLVAIDLPGKRHHRLCENLAHLQRPKFSPSAIAADLLEIEPQDLVKNHSLPGSYSKVVVDVPCSNTGVLRRRPDVSWRLDEAFIETIQALQLRLLIAASRFVAPGGTLIYSTCSIEHEENCGIVEAFLTSTAGKSFCLKKSLIHYPWQTGHDGGGVFMLSREFQE